MPRTRLLIISIRLICLLLLLTASGCATAAVATAGTMAGIAASAISTGSDVYRLGKLDSADEARYDQWLIATRLAAQDLGFTMEQEHDDGNGHWRCTLADARKTRIRVYVDRRTEMLCRTRIDVGIFGYEPTARLLLGRIREDGAASLTPPTTSPTTRSAATRQSALAPSPSGRGLG